MSRKGSARFQRFGKGKGFLKRPRRAPAPHFLCPRCGEPCSQGRATATTVRAQCRACGWAATFRKPSAIPDDHLGQMPGRAPEFAK